MKIFRNMLIKLKRHQDRKTEKIVFLNNEKYLWGVRQILTTTRYLTFTVHLQLLNSKPENSWLQYWHPFSINGMYLINWITPGHLLCCSALCWFLWLLKHVAENVFLLKNNLVSVNAPSEDISSACFCRIMLLTLVVLFSDRSSLLADSSFWASASWNRETDV